MLKVASESQLIGHHIKIMSPLSESCLFLHLSALGGDGEGQGAFLGSKGRVFPQHWSRLLEAQTRI